MGNVSVTACYGQYVKRFGYSLLWSIRQTFRLQPVMVNTSNVSVTACYGQYVKRFGYSLLWSIRQTFRLQPVMVNTSNVSVTACYGQYVKRAARVGPDRIWPIQLSSSDSVPFFSKEDLHHIVKNRPGSDLDGLVRVWPNASCPSRSKPVVKNYRARFLAECNQPATSFPLSDSVAFFHRAGEKPGRI